MAANPNPESGLTFLDRHAKLEGPLKSSAGVVHAEQAEEDAEGDDANVINHDKPGNMFCIII